MVRAAPVYSSAGTCDSGASSNDSCAVVVVVVVDDDDVGCGADAPAAKGFAGIDGAVTGDASWVTGAAAELGCGGVEEAML